MVKDKGAGCGGVWRGWGGRERATLEGVRGTKEPEDPAGRTAWGRGWGREGQESAGSYLRQGPARPGREKTEGEAGRDQRMTAEGPAAGADASLRPGDGGGGGGDASERRQCACPEPAGSAGGKLDVLLPPLILRVSSDSPPPLPLSGSASPPLCRSSSRSRSPPKRPRVLLCSPPPCVPQTLAFECPGDARRSTENRLVTD